jgi:capsular exopolysaccharide synthesis family protein
MSRFFDPLRRAEREKASTVGNAREEEIPAAELRQDSLTALVLAFEQITPIYCKPGGVNLLPTCADAQPVVREKFNILRHRLNRMRQERPFNTLLVTSAAAKEGKTFVTVNLAASLASNSSRVLLVEADMRGSGLHEALGLEVLPGLGEILEGRLHLSSGIRLVKPWGFFCLQAGQPAQNPAALLESGRINELLAITGESFEWILLDSPPLNLFADAQCLAHLCNTVLMVVRPGVTMREQLQQAMAALEGTRMAGIVINGSDSARKGEYYYTSNSHRSDRSNSIRK